MAAGKAPELLAFVNERIDRTREKLIGHALTPPYLHAIGGQSMWVVDVLIASDIEYLGTVPFAESGRNVRNFVNEGTPVEIKKSNAGQFYITGLSDRQIGDVTKKTYSLIDEGLAFTDGWRRDESNDWVDGNDNAVDPGTPETIEYTYTAVTIPYGSLETYGTTPYGAKEIVRTP